MRRAVIAMIAMGLPVAAAMAQSVPDGIAAWRGGDPARAVEIWAPLAQEGDAEAQYHLGQAYRLGRGVAADLNRAKQLFASAARQGHLDARTNLGLMLYSEGDRQAALGWLRLAAQAGEPRAMLVFGTALFNGDVLGRNPLLGYALVSRAAAKDLAAAKGTLDEMDAVLDVEDRQRAVTLAQQLAAGERDLAEVMAEPPMALASARPVPDERPAAKPATVAATEKKPAETRKPASKPAQATVPAVSMANAYTVQLGAFSREGAAQQLFGSLKDVPVFTGKAADYARIGKVTRLRVGPFASNAEAKRACDAMAARGQACFVVAP